MTADRFFDLLPGVVRVADAERGFPLRALLRVLAGEADLVEQDIRRMYADLFIETCEPWVVPYLGDLVGHRWLPAPSGGGGAWAPRRQVADTIRNRRRKGTRSVLADLALASTGWPAVVEDGADRITVRVWRLPSWPLTRVRPHYEGRRTNSYQLSVLGNDAPLFGREVPRPITVDDLTENLDARYGEEKSLCLYENGTAVDAGRLAVQSLADWGPEVFGDRVALDPELGRVMFPESYDLGEVTVSSYYGFPGALGGGEYPRRGPARIPVAASMFRAGHLVDGGTGLLAALRANTPFTNYLRDRLDPAVDEGLLSAELNRIMQAYDLAEGRPDLDRLDAEGLQLLATTAGGAGRIRLNRLILEAEFPQHIRRAAAVARVRSAYPEPVIEDAVRSLQAGDRPPLHLVVELCDSGLYVEPVVVELAAHHTFELRAADGCRPTLILPERRGDIDDLTVRCGTGSRVVLDGLMVTGHPVRVAGDPAEVVVRHCTLVPGWELRTDCEPRHGEEPSLILTDRWGAATDPLTTCLMIDHSVLGTIVVQRNEVRGEPIRLHIRTSVVDAAAPGSDAITAPNDRRAHAVAVITGSTVIGRVRLHAVELGENSVFTGEMDLLRRQIGCLRYCYVPPGSRTPRRYACQPDLAMTAAGEPAPGPVAAAIWPRFKTERYGQPDYCRLADDCPREIREGADDAAEMGVHHGVHEPQRAGNLDRALRDYLPLGWGLSTGYEN